MIVFKNSFLNVFSSSAFGDRFDIFLLRSLAKSSSFFTSPSQCCMRADKLMSPSPLHSSFAFCLLALELQIFINILWSFKSLKRWEGSFRWIILCVKLSHFILNCKQFQRESYCQWVDLC
ncbi:hypothetical protein HanRHA438_Chr09g0415051 [Helianthus annuus]|nr:hypothetical protein HanRHA438_Chr09g0415051 [Helianthus annuus]